MSKNENYVDRLAIAMGVPVDKGEWTVEHRAKARELARALGVSVQAVNKLFDDTSKSLSAANNSRAARYLSVSSDWLATGQGERQREPGSLGSVTALDERGAVAIESRRNYALHLANAFDAVPEDERKLALYNALEALIQNHLDQAKPATATPDHGPKSKPPRAQGKRVSRGRSAQG